MKNFLEYLEYLAANGLTLDENGNEVEIKEENDEELKLERKYYE